MNKLKLTENQLLILKSMSDSDFAFPGRLQAQSFRKLETMGLATSELRVAKRDVTKGLTEFRPAYKRTPAGKEEASK